jgi:hypothetical protein
MPCDEYKELIMLHEWATHRVKVYLNPDVEARLKRTDYHTLYEKLKAARAEESETRRQMEAHFQSCQVCRGITVGGDEL